MLYSNELRVGYGTYHLEGGFFGLGDGVSTDIMSYSLTQEHKNILNSDWFYNYNFTFYQSDTVDSYQNAIGNSLSSTAFISSDLLPKNSNTLAIGYKYKGVDADIGVGYDLYHQSEDNYIGLGLNLGVSLPWIDTNSNNSNSALEDTIKTLFKSSKTTIRTYKIGPNITSRMRIYKAISAYALASASYQTGKVKNDYAHADFSANGWFSSIDLGLRFQNIDGKYRIFGLNISPNLYASLGYKYSYWKLNNVAIDISGLGLKFDETDMSMSTSVGYFSIGYNF